MNGEEGGEVEMMLQVELQDLRIMLKEKCEEIISDKKLAYEFYWRICDIEEDDRFTIVDDCRKVMKEQEAGEPGCNGGDTN